MRLTKLQHAALVLEEAGQTLVIDPGSFTENVAGAINVTGAVAIVITHQHPDHYTPAQLDGILAAAPGIPIFAPQGVADAAEGYDVTVVKAGDVKVAGPFTLAFFGEKHAIIHESVPVIDNVGVLVNGTLYYPGDSFTLPGVAVDTLAVPVNAPWLKISEVMDFVLAVAPTRAFATHEMLLSDAGKSMGADRITWATEQNGGTFLTLAPGDSIEL